MDLTPAAEIVQVSWQKYKLDADLTHLDQIIELARSCIARTSADQPHHDLLQQYLGLALGARFERTRDPEDLDAAVAAHRIAADVCDPSLRPELLLNVVETLRVRIGVTGDMSGLEEAQQAVAESLAALPPDHPHRDGADYLAGSLTRYIYDQTEDADTLPGGVEALRRAVESAQDPGLRAASQADLGVALMRQFSHTGDHNTLTEAVEVMRQSLPHAGRDQAAWLHNLGSALVERFRHFGDLQALNEAVEALRKSVTLPADRRAHANTMVTLTAALQHLAVRERDPGIVEEAVSAARESVAGIDSAIALENLANALVLRFDTTGSKDDLTEAAHLLEEVLRRRPFGTPGHAQTLSNLGGMWGRVYESTLAADALDEAITHVGRAVRADPQPDRQRALYQFKFASLLLLQAEATGDDGRLRAAARAFAEAARNESLEALTRVLAANGWSVTAAQSGDWPQALRAAEFAMELFPEVTTRRLARSDREHGLAELAGVAADAAACACQAGKPALALSWLEQGRGVLLGELLETQRDFTALQDQHPDLADQFAETTSALDELDFAQTPSSDLRHETARRRDDLLTRIRALPGHERFLRSPSRAELHGCAAEGPIVLVNVSDLRCDALVVLRDRLVQVPLPELTLDTAVARAEQFSAALHEAAQPDRNEQEAGRTVADVLAWLWDTVAGPVLDQLPGCDRLWWSPGGPLSALPLHAAQRDGQAVLDRVVSSYTPTVRALGWARDLVAAPVTNLSMLVVAVPETEGQERLRHIAKEVEALVELWDADELPGAQATRENVLAALENHSHVHFACHGVSDAENPARSRLLVHDGEPLTVLDVSRLRLPSARLAVLSACHTAQSAPHLADEAMHIAGAFQFAGYPSVVGTLWHVKDRIAANVSIAFHTALLDHGLDQSARALHDVVNDLRRKYPPSLWAAYLHTGA